MTLVLGTQELHTRFDYPAKLQYTIECRLNRKTEVTRIDRVNSVINNEITFVHKERCCADADEISFSVVLLILDYASMAVFDN